MLKLGWAKVGIESEEVKSDVQTVRKRLWQLVGICQRWDLAIRRQEIRL